ncbi:MAG: M16 family metallopeptidase, partial [Polyangiales bacterium]
MTLSLALVAVGCGSTPPAPPATPIPMPPPPPSVNATPAEKGPDLSQIPPPGTPKELAPAQVTRFETKGGLQAIAIASHALPIVHCRVVIRAGNAASILAATPGKSRAGIANMVAELMKDGGAGRFGPRDVADRVDALGSDLGVDVSADRVVFSMAVTKDKLDAALDVLGEVVAKPRFDAGEFGKLKARELDRVKQAEKGSGGWMARSALYRDLFGEGHPYAEVDATDQSIANIELADVRAFYKKLYVTGNVFVVVAGDVEV